MIFKSYFKNPTNDDERDDQREEDVVGDDNVAQADRDDQVEAEVERVDKRPLVLPVHEHKRTHRTVQANARNVGTWGGKNLVV